MQCRKNITIEDNKKRTNIGNFVYIYIYIYIYTNIPALYVIIIIQNEND